MRVLLPFDASDPKSRLSPLFDAGERREFADAMLADVLEAVEEAGHDPEVLATAGIDVDVPVTVDDRPLTEAVNAILADAGEPMAVLAADLPLATPGAVDRLLATAGPVVIAPGLGGGTNGLVVRDGQFRVDFHGASVKDHRQAAHDLGLEPVTVDSFHLALDVDEPADLAEVLLHAEGRAADWLRATGVDLSVTDGRVEVRRQTG